MKPFHKKECAMLKRLYTLLISLILLAAFGRPAEAALFGMSDLAPRTFGAPTWYTDLDPANPASLPLVACVDVLDGLCVLPFAGEEPDWDPALPPTLGPPPVNFPSEPFYHLVEAGLVLNGGGTGFLRIAHEFAFGGITGDPVDGEQIVFNRVRHRINAPVTGRYRITHPWGTFEQDVLSLGAGFEINSTIDEGCGVLPCDFNLALLDAPGRITGPFLRWDTGFPVIGAVSGASYLGDPAIPHTITGSVHVDPVTSGPANIYRVEVDQDFNGSFETLLGETNLFFVMGRLFRSLQVLQATNDAASTPADTAVTISVLANDTPNAGATLVLASVTIVGGSEVGGVATPNPANGTVLFTPTTGFNGLASFRYTVGDTTPATSNEATVTIQVGNVAPVANADGATTNMNTPVDIFVAGNDTDVDGNLAPVSIAIVTAPTQGTVLFNTPLPGWIRYTPNPGTFGLQTFTYDIMDTLGALSAPALVSVLVIPTPTVDITSASLGLRLFAVGNASGAPGAIGPRPPFVQLFAGIGLPTGPGCGGMTLIRNTRVNRRTGFWRAATTARLLRLRLGGLLPTHLCVQIPSGGIDIWPF